jgi:integrase/recombinase XerD
MTKPTTPLRQRMIEDMTIHNMSPLTQAAYIRSVAKFAAHYRTSPDKLTFEDVRNYQVHLVSRGLKTATIIPIMCAIRFLYGTTLGMKDFAEQIPLARKEDKLPTVLSRDEVMRFLKAVADLKMRTIFVTLYAAGLRVSEVVALTAADIDSQRMVIHIRQGKGRKDRYVMLSKQLLRILRDYYKRTRPSVTCLFPGQNGDTAVTARTVQRGRSHKYGYGNMPPYSCNEPKPQFKLLVGHVAIRSIEHVR